jgi:protein-S-isoprenylcysteine O-methyltransferase Ste14
MLLRKQMQVHGDLLFKYRGELPVVLIPPALILFYYHIKSNPGEDWPVFLGWYQWVCLGVVLLGQCIRSWTLGFAPHNTSGRNIKNQIADVVNSTGIYSIVRHPLYVGNFFMALGTAMLSCDAWFVAVFVLLFWIYYERIIYAEESFISAKFTENDIAWTERTPTFIPSFRHYQPSHRSFNWRKILRQEMNGIVATFGIFWLFQLVENYALYGEVFRGFDVWNIGLIASAVAYLVVRYLRKKKPKVLSDRV